MQGSIPSAVVRPRFVDSDGNVLNLNLVDSIRTQAQLPDDPQLHEFLSHEECNTLTISAMNRLYDAEKDASLHWLALILDDIARFAHEIARQPKPEKYVKNRLEKSKAKNGKENGKLLHDIRRLRTNMYWNCSMEDETRSVCPCFANSTASKVDLELIRLEYDLDARGKALDILAGDVWVELPSSLGFLCKSILAEYRKSSGTKSTLIKNAKLFQFDIESALDGKPVRYSNVRYLYNGLHNLSVALKEENECFDDIRNAVMSLDEYEKLIANAKYDLRIFVDRRQATRVNKELSDILFSLLNDISRVQARLSKATDLSEPPNRLKDLLHTLFYDVVVLIGTINRLPMRTGREPDSIRLRQLITELRYWHVKLTGESRSFTLSVPDTETNIPEFTTGPFFNFVKEVSGYLNLIFDDNTLRKVISQVRHDEEGTQRNPIIAKNNK